MAKIKNNCSSTTEVVVKSILSGKNIDATRVADILISLDLDLEKILRASLYFTHEIDKPVTQGEVIDDKGRTLRLTDYDFLANTVRYSFSYETTRWFCTEEEAQHWLAGKNRYAHAGNNEKYGSYVVPATAQVEDSSSMSYDDWERLAEVEPSNLEL